MKNIKAKLIISIILILIVGFGFKFVYSQNEEIGDKRFKNNVVFYPQHQDDEVLWGGTAIVDAINECGADNVYVVLVSDGSGVNVFNQNPMFKDISREKKKELRNNEFKSCLSKLGVKQNNIIILANEANAPGTHYDLMEKTIISFEKNLKSVTHIAHHYKYDDHVMHRKNGQVLKRLKDEHEVEDARYFIKPTYAKYINENKQDIYFAQSEEEKAKVKSALDEYKVIDEKHQKYGIGYTSAHSYFEHLYNDSKYTSILSVE